MNLSFLNIGSLIGSKIITITDILSIQNNNKNKELIGMVLKSQIQEGFNPDRISHIVKNIKFNTILNSLEAAIEFLDFPFGNQLSLIYNQSPNRIVWVPVFADNLSLITINAKIKR